MEATFKQRQQKLRKILSPLLKKYPALPREQYLKMKVLDLVMLSSISPDPFGTNTTRAFNRLTGEYVDWNEVRVTSTNELGELLEEFRLNPEHAVDIRNTAQVIFYKQNRLNLDFLSPGRPDEVKKYISSLKDIPETQSNIIMILINDEADMPPTPAVRRFSQRTGLVNEDATDNAARLIYKKTLPKTHALHTFYAICRHAQALCKENNPRCPACFMSKDCNFGSRKNTSAAARSSDRK